MSDEELIAAFLQGDESAFDELYRLYWKQLVAYFVLHGVPYQDAEDLAAETLLRVVVKGHTFNPNRATFRVWLFAIAYHQLVDYWRRRGRSREDQVVGDEESNEPWEEWVIDPSRAVVDVAVGEVIGQEMLAPVRECLAALPPMEREVLVLKIMGLELPEIKVVLDIPYGTAGRLLHQARQHMRECLQSKGYEVG